MKQTQKCRTLFLRINPQKIFFLKFILEGYDGLGTLSTFDQPGGIVLIRYPDSCEKELYSVINSLAPTLIKKT